MLIANDAKHRLFKKEFKFKVERHAASERNSEVTSDLIVSKFNMESDTQS